MTGDKRAARTGYVTPSAVREQRLRSIGVLAGGIAHNFNNLLAGPLSTLALLFENPAVPSATLQELRTIHSALYRGAEIARKLIAYAEEPGGGFEQVDIACLAEEVLDFIRMSISEGTQFNVSLGRDLPALHANPGQLRQLIVFLIANTSEALQDHPAEIRFSLSPARSREGVPAIRLVVGGTRSVMTGTARERAFDPGFSGEATVPGQDLSVVREIVRVHGGSIHVSTSPGNGCTFEVVLPGIGRDARSRERDAEVQAAMPNMHARSTVLIVEDENSLRAAVARLLTRRGFAVFEAADGSTGIEQFRAHQREIDTVLLDLTLPDVTSRKVLQEVRSARPDINMILTSAYGYETAVANLQDQRPWEFVRKPYRLEELLGLLSSSPD